MRQTDDARGQVEIHVFVHTPHTHPYVHIYPMFQHHARGTEGSLLLTSVGQGVAGKRHRGPVQGAGNSGSWLHECTCQKKVTWRAILYERVLFLKFKIQNSFHTNSETYKTLLLYSQVFDSISNHWKTCESDSTTPGIGDTRFKPNRNITCGTRWLSHTTEEFQSLRCSHLYTHTSFIL